MLANNLQSALKHCNVIDEALQKEVANNRMAGPYKSPPYHNLRCSGVGVVPKKDGGDPSRYSLQYNTIDYAIATYLL